LAAGRSVQLKSPAGPSALISIPGFMLSWSQFDTLPPVWRFTVIEIVSGRVGVEDKV
jgi:hypothetical protein